jgi:cytoskeletal protein CcmA (bactofilin family)
MLNKGSIFSGSREAAGSPPPIGRVVSKNAPATSPAVSPQAPANRAPEAEAAPEPAGAKLVVGPGVKLKGAEIQDCDTLMVEGRVEATMDSRFIQIADQGSFDGKVTIDVAEIRGRFSGELTAREQLIVHSTGRVSGTIRYGRIVVHEGGEVSGDIKALSAETATGNTRTKLPLAAADQDSSAAVMSRVLAVNG